MNNIYAIDFEANYDSEYGIKECGVWGYLHHKKFTPYLMSVVGENLQWVGHPSQFNWEQLPKDWVALAHNAGFDQQVMTRCEDLNIFNDTFHWPKEWHCTANLSVFLGATRDLKSAAKYLLGIEASKEMRNYMKGKTWEDAVAEGKADALMKYALDDSIMCRQIWVQYSDKWPEIERKTSQLTIEQTIRGVAVNVEMLNGALPGVNQVREESLLGIPWVGTVNEKGEEVKPLSALALRVWLKEKGIGAPTTTEAKSPEFMKWQEDHKDITVVKAMQTYRSANSMYLKGLTLQRQVRPDNYRYPFPMLYFGATTGRWSSGYEDERNEGAGFNIQNLTKETMYGLNLRNCIVADRGMKFVIPDFSQIEPRSLAWLTDNHPFMDRLRQGIPLYEAYARAQGSWNKSESLKHSDTKLYAQKKAEVLALGYGAGWQKFIYMCGMYGAMDCLYSPITAEDLRKFKSYIKFTRQDDKVADYKIDKEWEMAVNAYKIVREFRANETKITDFWAMLEADMRRHHGGTYTVELPSGRLLNYFNVNTIGGLTAQKVMGGPIVKMWGGFLTENVVQATARDVMRDALINLEVEGVRTLFTVHDEIVCEVPKNFDAAIVKEIMIQTPAWCKGLPLDVSMEEADCYKK